MFRKFAATGTQTTSEYGTVQEFFNKLPILVESSENPDRPALGSIPNDSSPTGASQNGAVKKPKFFTPTPSEALERVMEKIPNFDVAIRHQPKFEYVPNGIKLHFDFNLTTLIRHTKTSLAEIVGDYIKSRGMETGSCCENDSEDSLKHLLCGLRVNCDFPGKKTVKRVRI
ncbi:hypothetical protein BCR34DRAFT_565103 [Clohesyomyces aquaticus]|uniref:Uncharacterized protein n=1 Tax=Clohesyomyces aquaticus TaxID=1231657 RepID=A0A1Y1ZMK9_9PLEO|nr:hypothetical protein BCR34DRAFT_565103 [Clohesyomyces aquaticus]